MIYIIIALKSEAQAFVDRYKLQKNKLHDYTIYTAENLTVMVSGVGAKNAKNATETLIKNATIQDNDIFLNVGICAAKKSFTIGEVIKISHIVYDDTTYTINENALATITCVTNEINEELYDIVDMESYGFFEVTKNIKNRHIYKIVSDHFEPHKVTKEGTKKLIANTVNTIMDDIK